MPETLPLYRRFAILVGAIRNCDNPKNPNPEWASRHRDSVYELCKRHLPHGSGLDATVELIEEESTPDRLVFSSDFHHMDQNGYYDGWTLHKVVVTPSLRHDIDIRVTGRDRNGVKEYLSGLWHHALCIEVVRP